MWNRIPSKMGSREEGKKRVTRRNSFLKKTNESRCLGSNLLEPLKCGVNLSNDERIDLVRIPTVDLQHVLRVCYILLSLVKQ